MEQEHWQWQEPGTTWKGSALYHITLTVTDRQPLLGTLCIPGENPAKAFVRRSPFGDALVDGLLCIPQHHPEVRVLHFCLMPDHLHAVLYVQRHMACGIGTVVRGFWQGAKKLGRAAASFQPAAASFQPAAASPSSFSPNTIREQLKEESARFQQHAAALRSQMGNEDYYRLPVVFTEMPFVRPMSRHAQLPTTIRYLDMNPQRLATKRLRPGFFRVQKDIMIGSRHYSGVGNVALLSMARYDTVHVRHNLVMAADKGNCQPLRDYMNARVLLARQGVVMVSPFISPQEKQVMQVLLKEHHPFIYLTHNGFREYYKPADVLFEACAEGRVLILSPWPYESDKRHISRADCVALNMMAEEICASLSATD